MKKLLMTLLVMLTLTATVADKSTETADSTIGFEVFGIFDYDVF